MSDIVDSHCHVSDRWYEPVDTLLFQMDRCGVARAVMVQLLGGTDHAAMQAAATRFPQRLAWVGMIDQGVPDWPASIAAAADAGAAGLRMRPSWRSSGADLLALWRAVAAAGLRVSLAGTVQQFTDGKLLEIARALPELPLVLEHLGGLARADAGDRETELQALCELAAMPNILLKLPGLGQIAPRLPSPDAAGGPLDLSGVEALLTPVFAAFGPERLMWGSDFPPVASREGYANALGWCRELVARHWPEAVPAVFGGTAAHVWFHA